MKITLRKFITENCGYIFESEEYKLSELSEQGIKGNMIDEYGEAMYESEKADIAISIADLVRLESIDDLKLAYPHHSLESIKILCTEFYSKYKFTPLNELKRENAVMVDANVSDVDFWNNLAEGF